MKLRLSLIVSAVMLAVSSQTAVFAKDGTYTATTLGRNGDVTVQVRILNNKIEDVKVLNWSETHPVADLPKLKVPQDVVKYQSTNVNNVAGATLTTFAIKAAVQDCLKQAGLNPKDYAKAVPQPKKAGGKVEEKTDVIVVGAGGAGFAAALTAKALGVSVILLEKMPQVGGNSLISGAEMNVAQSWIQKELGIKDSPELHAQDTLKGGDYKGDPAVVETMTHGALPAAEWLKNTVGIRYEPHNLFQFGGNSVKRALIPVGQTGTEYITKLSALAQKEKIPVVTGMKAVALIKNKDGRVVGVSCESNGKKYDFYAKGGIILATGGFGANAAMVKKYNPSLDERFKTTDAPGTTGEALYMAQKAGAELVNMQYIQTYPICDPISGVIELIADARFDGAILINQEGKRFVEELQRRDVISHAILNQPDSYCYVLWNDNIGKISNTVKAHPEEYETFTKQGVMHTADNLKEVADFFKIPYDNLKATIDRVSQMAKDGGKDLDFHNRGGLKDLSTGKYYIIKAVPSIHHTMGGVRINPKAEALDKNGKPVPGLYAAGEVTGCTHGTNRLGGNAYTDIMVFGRIAGEQAAQAAKAVK